MLLTRPYTGIRHDSILYFGQALRELLPNEFNNDLFFAFGSQAQFTFFPQLMAGLLRLVTPAQASMGALLGGFLFFLGASWFLLRQLMPQARVYPALVLLVALPGGYGAYSMLSYAEPFLTARTYAEPLALLGLALFLADRRLIAGVPVLAAMLLHPLQTVPVLLIAWFLLVQESPRWLHLAWLVLVVGVLAALGVFPLSVIGNKFDTDWFAWVDKANPMVFLSNWSATAWCQLLGDTFVLVVAAHVLSPNTKKYARAVLFAVGFGFGATLLLADVGRFVLPTGVQLWRIQWIGHWSSVALLPSVVLHFWSRGSEIPRQQALFIVAAGLLGAPAGMYSTALAVPLVVVLFFAWPRFGSRASPLIRILSVGAIVSAMVLAYAKYVTFVAQVPRETFSEVLALAFLHPLPLCIGAFLMARGSRSRGGILVISSLLITALLVSSVVLWDKRSGWNRRVESIPVSAASPFGFELPSGSQVYWLDELLTPWLVLHRASYWNAQQESGVVFNRRTAREANARTELLARLDIQNEICRLQNQLENSERCKPDLETLQGLCSAAQGQLDFVVMPYAMDVAQLGAWSVPAHAHAEKPVTYHLYGCAGSGRAQRAAAALGLPL